MEDLGSARKLLANLALASLGFEHVRITLVHQAYRDPGYLVLAGNEDERSGCSGEPAAGENDVQRAGEQAHTDADTRILSRGEGHQAERWWSRECAQVEFCFGVLRFNLYLCSFSHRAVGPWPGGFLSLVFERSGQD